PWASTFRWRSRRSSRRARRASGSRSAPSTRGSRSSSSSARSASSPTASASRARWLHEAALVAADVRTCGLCPRVRRRCEPLAFARRKELMRALWWSLAPMPALLVAYLLAPPAVVGGVALGSGAFVVFIVFRTVRLLRRQELDNRRFTSLVRNS